MFDRLVNGLNVMSWHDNAVHQTTLRCQVALFLGWAPNPIWKHHPDHPRTAWIDSPWRFETTSTLLWISMEIRYWLRSLGSDATVQADFALTTTSTTPVQRSQSGLYRPTVRTKLGERVCLFAKATWNSLPESTLHRFSYQPHHFRTTGENVSGWLEFVITFAFDGCYSLTASKPTLTLCDAVGTWYLVWWVKFSAVFMYLFACLSFFPHDISKSKLMQLVSLNLT